MDDPFGRDIVAWLGAWAVKVIQRNGFEGIEQQAAGVIKALEVGIQAETFDHHQTIIHTAYRMREYFPHRGGHFFFHDFVEEPIHLDDGDVVEQGADAVIAAD